ncbi:UbiX family flavin prenyltransferase [Neisseria sp. Ec49-e6-T10]|uniref:UbiX family flavin prenyltransferase n=1 Tax=Neisseria sp. Ec49-e6-T10 TaxID=3140744 RepID=UPI003EBA9530
MNTQRMIIGISGATGFLYGVRALELLKPLPHIETHLVVSKAAQLTRQQETLFSKEDIESLADVVHPVQNIGAAIASGSFKTMGMLIAPCSMNTLASVANGLSDNLLARAADVVLKERRTLVLMTRESPLHLGHLRNMQLATEMGAIICPPVPAMYQQIQSVDDMVTYSVARALDLFGFDIPNIPRWGEQLHLNISK